MRHGPRMPTDTPAAPTSGRGSPSTSGHATLTYGSTSLTGYGIQLGLPVTIAGVVQLLPLYSLYFAGDAYHHFSVTAGVVLGR